MKAFVLTSDPGNWCLPGFQRQWNLYAPFPVTIYGYTNPGIDNFISLGSPADFPKERWSDGLIAALQHIKDDLVMLFLEDYWLTRPINEDAVRAAVAVMMADPSIARFDLTSDRMFADALGTSRLDWGSIGAVDIFESLAPDYRCSFQTSLWRKQHLLSILTPGESPWEAELNGCARMVLNMGLRVLATYQWPVRYQIVVNKGEFDRSGAWQRPARSLSPADWKALDALGCTQAPRRERG